VIAVAQPVFGGNERRYLLEAFDAGQVSAGPFVRRFEAACAEAFDVQHAIAVSNGSSALHLAMLALDLQPGDEVIVPTLTYVATANAVAYCGARPVFVDLDPLTGCIDPVAMAAAITERTVGVICVHLYGHPCDMAGLDLVCATHDLWLVEDCAEAHGATYASIPVGQLGQLATYSFYGNKIVTCGEGGLVTTDDDALAARVRLYAGQGQTEQYWHPVTGYNYRMTDLQAAVGLGQVEMLAEHVANHRQVAGWYEAGLADCPGVTIQPDVAPAMHARWMVMVQIAGDMPPLEWLATWMRGQGVETRPLFWPLHRLPMWRDDYDNDAFPIANHLRSHGLLLPTHGALREQDVRRVCEVLRMTLAALETQEVPPGPPSDI
jgi:perosamine synthetase